MIAATLNITPKNTLALGGYINRKSDYIAIENDLEINIILYENLFFISMDTLYVTHELKNIICKETGVSQKNLFIAATHTHFAPSLDKEKPSLGEVNQKYYDFIVKTITEKIIQMQGEEQKNVTLLQGSSFAYHSINRRYFKDGDVMFRPNYEGSKHEDIHTVLFNNNKNEPLAIIINYACHPTSSINRNHVGSDYINEIRNSLREIYNHIPILFFQGFSGEIRPCCINEKGNFSPFTKKEYKQWSKSLSKRVHLSCQNSSPIAEKDLSVHLAFMSSQKILRDSKHQGQIPFHHIKIGNLIFVGVGAEVVSDYIDILKKYYKDSIVIATGCVNDSFGYLPTDEMIQQGGYEAGAFFEAFDMKAKFQYNIEKIITDYLLRL